MGKYRIYEIAKELNQDSKVVLDYLSAHKIAVKSHMSSVDDDVHAMILRDLGGKSQPKSAPTTGKEERTEHKAKTAPAAPVQPVAPKQEYKPEVKVETKVEPKPVVRNEASSQAQPRMQHQGQQAARSDVRPAMRTENRPEARPMARPQENRPTTQGTGSRPMQKIILHRNPNWKSNNNNGNNSTNSNRPQGQFNRDRNQDRNQGQNRSFSQDRNQEHSQDRRPFNRPNGNGPTGNRNFSGGDRPQGQRFNNNRPGGNFRPQGGNRPFQGNNNRGQGYNRPPVQEKPPVPVDINAAHAGKEMGKRGMSFNRKDKKDKNRNNYQSKENNYSNNFDRFPKKHKNGLNKDVKPQQEIIRPNSVEVGESIAVNEFAKLLKRSAAEVISKLIAMGQMVTINQQIDHETAALVGMELNCEVKDLPVQADPTEVPEVVDDPALRIPRPPVVTVMGHVDHGKTSLLDAIRKSHITAGEAGGITQHIGAYQVTCQGKPIVFLDTPGHEAFTAMRARGAQVTDVAVLVVAADDGVMPQTLEAIHHAKAAKVPIIVAINKIDKEGANPEFVKQQLAEHELIPEDWGGDTIMVPVSAHQKTGIAELLEMILLVAEVQELKANPDLPAQGTIIEAELDKGRGPVATVLISRGTLHIGDTILAGTAYGKVRALVNDRGEQVKKALPSTPVEVLGLNDVPNAGDTLDATEEHIARSVAEKRIAKKKDEEQKVAKVSLDDIFNRIQEGELKELNIVVKADVQGTIEALQQSLSKIKNDEVKVVVVHAGVGTINESDVMLASAANAIIIGFNVRPDANARKVADTEKVDIRTYRVIYDALNDVEAAIKGMLAPKFKENIIGHVEVRQLITISKMLIAGAYVTDGKITRSSKVRVLRNGIVVHEGELESLRRFKDDVKEVAQGFECGLTLENYRDIKEGDVLEVYVMEEIAQ